MDAPRGFSRYLGIAERFLARGRVPALLIAVARKRSRLKLVKSDLRLLQELLVAWVRGEYRGLSRQALLSVIAALAYFLSPVDIVPDFIFGVGLLDDLAVDGWGRRGGGLRHGHIVRAHRPPRGSDTRA